MLLAVRENHLLMPKQRRHPYVVCCAMRLFTVKSADAKPMSSLVEVFRRQLSSQVMVSFSDGVRYTELGVLES